MSKSSKQLFDALFSSDIKLPIEKVNDPTLPENLRLDVLRLDLVHPQISGNKYFKLKYNLKAFLESNNSGILTFGGAYSNHIHAVAAACSLLEIESIGVIRGERIEPLNPTLSFAESNGMQLHFVNRTTYREKNGKSKESLINQFDDFFMIPEGGTNALAVKGCHDIIDDRMKGYDYICLSAGTGGTAAGLLSANLNSTFLIFPALKGSFMPFVINNLFMELDLNVKTDWKCINDYHFGGYAKISNELIAFIKEFKKKTDLQLEPVYTGKMAFGVYDLIKKGFFPSACRVLMIHTGGLQGLAGFKLD